MSTKKFSIKAVTFDLWETLLLERNGNNIRRIKARCENLSNAISKFGVKIPFEQMTSTIKSLSTWLANIWKTNKDVTHLDKLQFIVKSASKGSVTMNKFYLGKTFRKQRKRITHKLKNARLQQIHFHTLRHWKATMEYHKTKDILHVKQLLGHKNIENTLKYTQLVNFKNDEYTCKVAKTIKDASELIEVGFEYVTE